MTEEDKKPKIEDINASKGATDKLKDVEEIPAQDVLDAVDQLKESAIAARAKEIHKAEISSSNAAGTNAETSDSQRRSEAKGDLAEYDIDEMFKYFHECRPADAAATAGHFVAAKKSLSSGEMSVVVGVSDIVSKWAGKSKDAFKTNFLDPLVSQTIFNQQALCDELAVAATAYEGVLRAGLVDAKHIAEECTKVLDQIAEDVKTPDATDWTLKTIEIAVTIAGGATGGPIGITFGLLTTGISLAKDATAHSTAKFDQPTVQKTMDKLVKELKNLKKAMEEEEESVAAGLEETLAEVETVLGAEKSLEKASILANEPSDDKHHDVTSGDKPPKSKFHPPRR